MRLFNRKHKIMKKRITTVIVISFLLFFNGLYADKIGLNDAIYALQVVSEMDSEQYYYSHLFDKNESYWAQFLPSVNQALDKDLSVDVAVIGGGYSGLSAAYHIKKSNPSLQVVIFEAKRVGNGASGRNGGLVLAQTYSEGGFIMGENKKYHKEIYEITLNSMKRIKELAESSGIDPEYVLNGQCLGIKHILRIYAR